MLAKLLMSIPTSSPGRSGVKLPKLRLGLGNRWSFGSFAPLRPGELVGIDIKSFASIERGGGRVSEMHHGHARKVGWRHLHVAIDMASRLVFAEFRPTVRGTDAAAFLDHALRFFA